VHRHPEQPASLGPAVTVDHGGVPELDPEQLAVLRLLKAAFGEVELLEVIDDAPTATLPAAQGWLFDGEGDDGLAPDEPPEPG
jgi:hypothetical protein